MTPQKPLHNFLLLPFERRVVSAAAHDVQLYVDAAVTSALIDALCVLHGDELIFGAMENEQRHSQIRRHYSRVESGWNEGAAEHRGKIVGDPLPGGEPADGDEGANVWVACG